MKKIPTRFTLLLAFGLCLCSVHPANAYLDPGSGSMLLQVIAAAVLGALVTCRLYARKLMGAVRRFFVRGEKAAEEADGDHASKP